MVKDAERGTSGDKRVLLWEVRQKWDLDQFKAKANCQDSQVGRREGPGIREGASVWTRACSCCRSELTVHQRDALPAQGTGQVAKGGQLRQQVRRSGMGTRW